MSARASLSPRVLPEPVLSKIVDTIKTLAIDAVQKANSGHPGMPMGAAVMGGVLWGQFLVHDPKAPHWPDRDRFVLSAGHGSMLQYALLHLAGYDLPIEELQRFRQWDSRTPGHPEHRHTVGVEVTTGPLGTGFAAAVGFALAERILAGTYNRPGHEIVDHFTYGICSDGDLMEGISAEAASFAGHNGLGKLIFLYDDNHISIDGPTDLSFSQEDVAARFTAYGWHVQRVDGHDAAAVAAALVQARSDREHPSLICCRTTIAHGSPNKAGTSGSHGSPLGDAEIAATKRAMGWPEDAHFLVPDEVRAAFATQLTEQGARREEWEARFAAYREAHPQLAAQFSAHLDGDVPQHIIDQIPSFPPGGAMATRKAGGKVLSALVAAHPTLVGGSADLAGSNGVELSVPSQSRTRPDGRAIHFGVREHGMAGICNGLMLHGGLRVFDATFLVFSDFMRGALRLSALMKLPIVHVFTHDSFWVGEDGPTHQPIEQLMSLRLIPNLFVVRPADARETAAAWRLAMQRGADTGPTAILLTRQDLPTMPETREDIAAGAYVLWQPDSVATADLDGILVATGSEVATALEAARELAKSHGRSVRVVSMPCWEAFLGQPESYRDEVLPPAISRRLSVEAGTTFGWSRFAAHQHGIDHYGASAPGKLLAEKFGFTPAALVRRFLELP